MSKIISARARERPPATAACTDLSTHMHTARQREEEERKKRARKGRASEGDGKRKGVGREGAVGKKRHRSNTHTRIAASAHHRAGGGTGGVSHTGDSCDLFPKCRRSCAPRSDAAPPIRNVLYPRCSEAAVPSYPGFAVRFMAKVHARWDFSATFSREKTLRHFQCDFTCRLGYMILKVNLRVLLPTWFAHRQK